MFKNLLKEEKNKDIFNIIIVLVFYLIVFSIFKAGLDFQKIIPAKNYEKPKVIKEFNYEIISNGNLKKIKYNEEKSLTQILDGFYEKNIEIRILREGRKIESIYNSRRISILVNGKNIDTNMISDESIAENSIITVNY